MRRKKCPQRAGKIHILPLATYHVREERWTLRIWTQTVNIFWQHQFTCNWSVQHISPWARERRKRCFLPLCSCLDELARLILQTRPEYERRKRCPVWGSHTIWGTFTQGRLRMHHWARVCMCEWSTNYRNNKRFKQSTLVLTRYVRKYLCCNGETRRNMMMSIINVGSWQLTCHFYGIIVQSYRSCCCAEFASSAKSNNSPFFYQVSLTGYIPPGLRHKAGYILDPSIYPHIHIWPKGICTQNLAVRRHC